MNRIFEKFILFVAVLWYTITAYYSSGYHHPDEHYQIIEFAGLLDGKNTADDFAWEYKAHIRPSIQPLICFIIFKVCDFLTLADPYTKAFILRLSTCLFAIIAIYFFTQACRRFIEDKYWISFLLISHFIWFLPFINVRFSSETWSGFLYF